MTVDKYVCRSDARCSSECSNAKGGELAGKIKGGREVRIRLSQRMLELLSDFLARIMEHSLKKAFARDRDTRVPFSLFTLSRTHPPLRLFALPPSLFLPCARATDPLLLLYNFSFVLSNENSKLLAAERNGIQRWINNDDKNGVAIRAMPASL